MNNINIDINKNYSFIVSNVNELKLLFNILKIYYVKNNINKLYNIYKDIVKYRRIIIYFIDNGEIYYNYYDIKLKYKLNVDFIINMKEIFLNKVLKEIS